VAHIDVQLEVVSIGDSLGVILPMRFLIGLE
jgi:hypothetical protein